MGDMSPCKHGGSVGYCSICNPELEELTNELATLREQVVSQQARIAQMRTALNEYVDVIISYNDPETWQPTCRDNGHHARIALATTDDLSSLKAHDDALWNEAVERCLEAADRGRPSDAVGRFRSLKR